MLGGDARDRNHVDDALEYFKCACGLTDERLTRQLRAPTLLWMSRNTGRAYDAADVRIAAWHDYQRVAELLRVQWGVRKFFKQGHCLKPESWPIDRAALRCESRVGVNSCNSD